MSRVIMIIPIIMVIFIGFVSFGKAGLATNANWTVVGQADSNFLGRCVADAGDVNGDGYADVIIGAPNYDNNRGKAYVFLGSASGLQSTTNLTAVGEDTSDWFGGSVSGAGDVNGDGYADMLIGAEGYDNKGKAYLFLGSSAGPQATTNWTAVGEAVGNYLAGEVSGAGDIDGDGLADLISVVGSDWYVWFSTSQYLVRGGPYMLSLP